MNKPSFFEFLIACLALMGCIPFAIGFWIWLRFFASEKQREVIRRAELGLGVPYE